MDGVVLFGPPCAGKGTAADIITATYPMIRKVATGDLCRAAKADKDHPRLQEMLAYDKAGDRWPDSFIAELLDDHLKTLPAKSIAIFDGYPRTMPQAEYLDKIARIAAVYNFTNLTDEVLEQRRKKRVAHNHAIGVHRAEDVKEAFEKRLKDYYAVTFRVLRHYNGLAPIVHVNASQSPAEVAAAVSADLESRLSVRTP